MQLRWPRSRAVRSGGGLGIALALLVGLAALLPSLSAVEEAQGPRRAESPSFSFLLQRELPSALLDPPRCCAMISRSPRLQRELPGALLDPRDLLLRAVGESGDDGSQHLHIDAVRRDLLLRAVGESGDSGSRRLHIDAVRKTPVCEVPVGTNNAPVVAVWRLPASGLTYVINVASIPNTLNTGQVVQAVQNAAAAWTAQGAPKLIYGGAVTSSGSVGDGMNVIGFGAVPPGTSAVAAMVITDGVVAEAEITLDSSEAWATNLEVVGALCEGAPNKLDIQNALMHEFGHWVGAGHTPVSSEYNHRIMFPFIAPGELFKRWPAAGDLASIPSAATSKGAPSGSFLWDGDDSGGP